MRPNTESLGDRKVTESFRLGPSRKPHQPNDRKPSRVPKTLPSVTVRRGAQGGLGGVLGGYDRGSAGGLAKDRALSRSVQFPCVALAVMADAPSISEAEPIVVEPESILCITNLLCISCSHDTAMHCPRFAMLIVTMMISMLAFVFHAFKHLQG